MTNGEYHKKHRRGSSPSLNGETLLTYDAAHHPPSEEWKNLIWYPVSPAVVNGMESRNTLPRDMNTKGTDHG